MEEIGSCGLLRRRSNAFRRVIRSPSLQTFQDLASQLFVLTGSAAGREQLKDCLSFGGALAQNRRTMYRFQNTVAEVRLQIRQRFMAFSRLLIIESWQNAEQLSRPMPVSLQDGEYFHH